MVRGWTGHVWLRVIVAAALLMVCSISPPGLASPPRMAAPLCEDASASPPGGSPTARAEGAAAAPARDAAALPWEGAGAPPDGLSTDVPAPPPELSRRAEDEEEKAALRGLRPARGKAQVIRVIIDISGLRLMLQREGEVIRTYPIAAGKPSTPSPRGGFVATAIVHYPTWYPRGGRPVPPGPSNPLGSRWISLSDSGYGVHGTNNDSSIGKYVSKGCIRMHNADVEELCGLINVGIPMIMTDAPDVSGDVYAIPGAKSNRSLPE